LFKRDNTVNNHEPSQASTNYSSLHRAVQK